MNGPIKPQKCQIDQSYCKFGSEKVLKLIKNFAPPTDGVIKNKNYIKCVHKTRVTSRRLRATMPLFRFCFPRKDFKKWSGKIKKVTPLLANARDLDVQITFIEKYRQKLTSEPEKAGIDVFLECQRDDRKNIQPSIVNGLNKLRMTGTLKDIRRFCEETIADQSNEIFEPNKVLEKARWNISFRLDDFLSMEQYVYLENETQRHHEMRIFAKKLRYTMEIFAELYGNKLEKEIETIKSFQDVLGEMQDNVVWIEQIPKFIDKTKETNKEKIDAVNIEKALFNLLSYLQEKKKELMNQFVNLWNENKKSGFFIQLRKTISGGLNMNEEKIKEKLANPDIKIAVLSDIHANLQALEKVIEDAEEHKVDIFLNAGDSIGFGPYPNEVIELLCEKNMLSVLGNYDSEVIEGKAKAKGEKKVALKFARKELAKSCECYLYSLPRELHFEIAGKKLFVTHGSPKSIEEHIYHDTPDKQLKSLADEAGADVIILGHSHEQFWKQVNGASFVNPGSVGRPSDENPQTAYAILSFNPFNIELIRCDYDVEATAQALRKKELPESFAQMILRGVSLDRVIVEDIAKEKSMTQDYKTIVEKSRKIAEKYWPDKEHYEQVTRLALEFFDELINIHELGQRERCWLECATILHDVGLSKTGGSHHKKSAKLILNDTQLPFTSQERRIIASIARYHRKGLPKPNHYNLATLDDSTIEKLKILASILRVADGLDCSHESAIRNINLKVEGKRITVECVSEAQLTLEEQAFNKKKDLFEKVFDKKLMLTWEQK